LQYASRTPLIANAVKAAVGLPLNSLKMPKYNSNLAEIILHSDKEGKFWGLELSKEMNNLVVETDLWVKPGDKVWGFSGANNAIGTLVLRFNNNIELEEALMHQRNWLRIIVHKFE
ncbi:MAG: hypothetical protein K2H85_10120, partial [Allobaculum sp.]|nr:hypothetical protein [Allobaculum sp.]